MLDHDFKLKPSKQYIALLAVTSLAGAGIVFCLTIPAWAKIMGVLLVICYGIRTILRFGVLKSSSSIINIKKLSDSKWQITTPTKVMEAELCKDSTVTGFVILLRFKVLTERFAQSCIIFRDALSSENYRKLLVVLKNT